MKFFKIDQKSEGIRVFNFIKKAVPKLKNSEIFKLVRKKVIKVNNKKTTTEYILNNDDLVQIYLKEDHFKASHDNKFHSINKKINIIFEDKNLLIVNKPVGILTHPSKNDYRNNMYEAVRYYLYSKEEYNLLDYFSPTPCHRLDRNTSGLLIFAKNQKKLKKVTEEIRNRNIIKIYLTLVYGNINKRLFIASEIESTTEKVRVLNLKKANNISELKENNNLSTTIINPHKVKNNYSLLNVELLTGKKHQIRAHLAAAGNPLLGDKKYFNKNSLILSKELKIKNLFLHAYKLKLLDYDEWIAPIPERFENIIIRLF